MFSVSLPPLFRTLSQHPRSIAEIMIMYVEKCKRFQNFAFVVWSIALFIIMLQSRWDFIHLDARWKSAISHPRYNDSSLTVLFPNEHSDRNQHDHNRNSTEKKSPMLELK